MDLLIWWNDDPVSVIFFGVMFVLVIGLFWSFYKFLALGLDIVFDIHEDEDEDE